jgi:hypothetical protein
MNTNPNFILQVDRAFVGNVPAAPAANATVVLFATHPCTLGTGGASVVSTFIKATTGEAIVLSPDAIEELEAVFGLHDKASVANGVRAYYTNDGGANWRETDIKDPDDAATIGSAAPIQVPVLSAGQEWAEIFRIGRYRGFAITYTAGSTGPTAVTGWDVAIGVKYASQGG